MSLTTLRRFGMSTTNTFLHEGSGLNYIYYKVFPEDYCKFNIKPTNNVIDNFHSNKLVKPEIKIKEDSSTLAYIYEKIYNEDD